MDAPPCSLQHYLQWLRHGNTLGLQQWLNGERKRVTAALWHPPGTGSRAPRKPGSVDAQVPPVKWGSVCTSPTHILRRTVNRL